MQILTFPLGQLQANCYFLIKDNECVILDPADSADFILEEVVRRNLKVVGLIATHGHFDHIMAVGELQLALSSLYSIQLPLYIHEEDLFLVKRLRETAKYFLGYEPNIIDPQSTHFLKPTKSLKIEPFQFEVIHTPGHTPGSCCFYFKKDRVVFTGDTLFKGAIGSYEHSYSDKNELKNSLQNLFKLPKKVVVYPGHGEKTTIENEK